MTQVDVSPSDPVVSSEPLISRIASRRSVWQGFQELYEYRSLFLFFTWRDYKVRYKQSLLGMTWAVLRPLIQTLVFTVFFGGMLQLSSDGQPFAAFVLAALLPWQIFSQGVTNASEGLVAHGGMIKKIYFPRMLVPASRILTVLIDFAVAFGLFLVVALWMGLWPTWHYLLLPLAILHVVIFTAGLGLLTSAASVFFRDVRQVVPFTIQTIMFATPVFYSFSAVPEDYQIWYALNPLVGNVLFFRWILLPAEVFPAVPALMSLVISLLVALLGFWVFERSERHFADVV